MQDRGVIGSGPALVLAALAAGAGAIHFAMTPSHAGEWLLAGIFFAVLGVLQVGLAGALLARPTREVVLGGSLLSLGVLGVWAVARTSGMPFGPEANVAEPVTSVDLICSAFEVAFLVVAAVALRWRLPVPRLAGWVPAVGVLALTTAIVVSPSARNHAHHHTAGQEVAAGAHVHADGSIGTAAEAAAQTAVPGIATHQHGDGTIYKDQPLSPPIRQELAGQLVQARAVAMRYPTVTDAERDGYVKITPYVPLIGAHYMKFSIVDGRFDIEHPEMLLYDGTNPGSKMVGLSYYEISGAEPAGFAGPNDHWHRHLGLCIAERDGHPLVVGGENTTAAQCRRLGGVKTDGAAGWMVHAWVVPSWESPQGVFSAENPDLV